MSPFNSPDCIVMLAPLPAHAAAKCISRIRKCICKVVPCGFIAFCAIASTPSFAQTCPTKDPAIDAAKSNKLFLYFPTTVDTSFPSFPLHPNVPNVTPAQPFDVHDLDPSIGSTPQLIDEIRKVVTDDYCEFNVQVLATTTNPATLSNPPPRSVTVAIGSDANDGSLELWGVSSGEKKDVDFARVWAGTYTICEGGLGPAFSPGGCSTTGSLTGSNATLQRWAQAIGGTAAHEAGHNYGLSHNVDDPQVDPCRSDEAGPPPIPGEDAFNRHLMPAGCNLTGPDRAAYQRHFSNRDYGILATNVGLSIETMHNWELINPNAGQAAALTIDFLSPLGSISLASAYGGTQSPWLTPIVSNSLGTVVFRGQTYNKFRITWSTGNPAWGGPSPGIVGGGAVFQVGVTLTGVDFNQPDPIIIQDVTLLDAWSQPLPLHPRLPSYDSGTLLNNQFMVNFFAPPRAPALRMVDVSILQLPRFASIDSLVNKGRPVAWDGNTIAPWAGRKCASGALGQGRSCIIARLGQRPHVQVTYRLGQPNVYECRQGVPVLPSPGTQNRQGGKIDDPRRVIPPQSNGATVADVGDSALADEAIDDNGPICAGTQRDPFPSAVVYVMATFMDPNVRHFDGNAKKYVVGAVQSKVFYQFAGIRRVPEHRPNPGAR